MIGMERQMSEDLIDKLMQKKILKNVDGILDLQKTKRVRRGIQDKIGQLRNKTENEIHEQK